MTNLWASFLAVLALALLGHGTTAQEEPSRFRAFDDRGGFDLTVVRRAPLPRGSVEVARTRPAREWSAPFCKEWTDGCDECSGTALEEEVYCKRRTKADCTTSAV